MGSSKAIVYMGVFVIGLAAVAGCTQTSDDGDADETHTTSVDGTFPASSTTVAVLGVSYWKIERQAESATTFGAAMTGYSAKGDAARQIKVIVRIGDTREALLEVAIDGQPAATAQTASQADGTSLVVRSNLVSSVDARKTITRYSADSEAAAPAPPVEANSLEIRTPLVGGGGDLIKTGKFIDCMEVLHPLIGGGLVYHDIVRICSPLTGS